MTASGNEAAKLLAQRSSMRPADGGTRRAWHSGLMLNWAFATPARGKLRWPPQLTVEIHGLPKRSASAGHQHPRYSLHQACDAARPGPASCSLGICFYTPLSAAIAKACTFIITTTALLFFVATQCRVARLIFCFTFHIGNKKC